MLVRVFSKVILPESCFTVTFVFPIGSAELQRSGRNLTKILKREIGDKVVSENPRKTAPPGRSASSNIQSRTIVSINICFMRLFFLIC